jgi:hypothetical protein
LFILAGGFSFSVKGFRAIWDDIYYVVVVITVDPVMLLRDFGPYGIIFVPVCLLR